MTEGFTELKLERPFKRDKGGSNDIKGVQERLVALNYARQGFADGIYGGDTAKAVEAFQRKAGLAVTGVVDSGTHAKLFAEDAPRGSGQAARAAPAGAPLVSYEQMRARLERANYDPDEEALLVVGIRGFYADGQNAIGRYDDALFVVRRGETPEFVGFRANTDPSRAGTNSEGQGIATLCPGRWPVYRFGLHGQSHIPRNGKIDEKRTYQALVQTGGRVKVRRWQRGGKYIEDGPGNFYINIHHGSTGGGTSSLGCQTVPYEYWTIFYKTCKDEARRRFGDGHETKTYTYILLEENGQAQQARSPAGSPVTGSRAPAPQGSSGRPTLRVRTPPMESEAVRDLQRLLQQHGHLGANEADGRFGLRTKNAVVAFQKTQGLKADGIVGDGTWNALLSASSGGGSSPAPIASHSREPGVAMRVSADGLELIKGFESFSAKRYLCPAGKPTIGYGHVVLAGEPYDDRYRMSQDQALDLLENDCAIAEAAINRLVKVPLAQYQYDALVSFVFNVGVGQDSTDSRIRRGFAGSTLLKKLNARDYAGAAAQFGAWCKSGGEKLPGLVRRRSDEAAMFRATPQR